MMTPLLMYRDWIATDVPNFDLVDLHTFSAQENGWGICPDPFCLAEIYDVVNVTGPVLLEGMDGEPTAIAVPCARHQEFRYTPGWYSRFATAHHAARDPRIPDNRPHCRKCGEEYDTFLYGYGGNGLCPECTYRQMQHPAPPTPPPGLRKMAMAA